MPPLKQPVRTNNRSNRGVPGLYEEFLVRIRNTPTKDGIKNILNNAVSLGREGALNEVEVNSLIRIGNQKMDNIYEARGGVHTYKPQSPFNSRDIGI